MNDPILTCQDEQRRHQVRKVQGVNGLDYLEIDQHDRTRLIAYFLGKAPEHLRKENVVIQGGRRIRNIQVDDIKIVRQRDPELDDALIVTLDRAGDFSTYTLGLVETDEDDRPTKQPLAGFDPRYARLEFSFSVDCPSDFDCQTEPICPPEQYPSPDINYLAKDYAGFRRLILDRLALIMPEWQERHIPDLGITLVEILAYVGDHLSYYQDAVVTEAYLNTARQRVSVRRHARLLDYAMHEGCNARTWVCLATDTDLALNPAEMYFTTRYNNQPLPDNRLLNLQDLQDVRPDAYEVFEPCLQSPSLPWLSLADLKHPASLAVKLRDAATPLAQYIRAQLPQDVIEQLDLYDGIREPRLSLQQAIVARLNWLIRNGKRYDQDDLSVRLSRTFFEQAFPLEIARRYKPGDPIHIYAAHNKIHFYTWGDQACCLPQGATSATLKDEWLETEPSEFKDDPIEQISSEDDPTEQISSEEVSTEQISSKEVLIKEISSEDEPTNEIPLEETPEPPPRWPEPKRKLRHLQPGDVLIFEQVIGPKTGNPADANLAHRHAVRLTSVKFNVDWLYDQPVVEIQWAPADALPFPLCLSIVKPGRRNPMLIEDISLAWGNTILVDHGRRVEHEALGSVPLANPISPCEDEDWCAETRLCPDQFRPHLKKTGLTHSQALPAEVAASTSLTQDPRQALPQIKLSHIPAAPGTATTLFQPGNMLNPTGLVSRLLGASDFATRFLRERFSSNTQKLLKAYKSPNPLPPDLRQALQDELNHLLLSWTVQPELLDSNSQDRHFVVELDNEGIAHLRFGNGELGRVPQAGATFIASYRVGNGPAGNIGAETISYLVLRQTQLDGVQLQPRNPLAAEGGVSPELLADVKSFAPYAFGKELKRAITADDYARLASAHPKVQRAAATLRWMGSWHEVLIAIDPLGQTIADEALLREVSAYMHPYRRIGHDMVVAPARYVPLDIEMTICVHSHFLRGHVKADLLSRFSSHLLPNGERGLFHPDNLTFGQGVFLSKLVATAQATPGVKSVVVDKFQRLYENPNQEIENGILPLGPLEIGRLDNDPSFPEHGRLGLKMRGGR